MSTSSAHTHDHSGGLFGQRTELIFSIASGVFWAVGLLLVWLADLPEPVTIGLFVASIILGGYYALIEAYEGVSAGRFEIDFLMIVAAAGAAALGKWEEAALLLFLFSLGHALEHYAMARARKSISALAELVPATALLQTADGDTREVPVEELEVGQVVVVKPNTKIPADGVVISGASAVDQSAITGESIPVEKVAVARTQVQMEYRLADLPAEHRTFAGTINGSSVLEVRVLRPASDSTLTKLVNLVQEAEAQKSPTQHLTDKFERYYVPAVLVLVGLLLFAFLVVDETFGESFYRAMAVLVAASPCALAISTPAAVLAGVARAAQKGVLIKGGRPLEDLGSLTAIAFDKTGTLTEGKPKLTAVLPAQGVSRHELLTTAVAVEELSDHPLAAAIVAGGEEELGGEVTTKATGLEALTARGIRAVYGGRTVHVGNRRLMREVTGNDVPTDLDRQLTELETGGHTAMLVHAGDRYLGVMSVMDVARASAAPTLAALRELGIERMVMLTGDNQRVANAVAREIGITDPLGSLLPEDKVDHVRRLREREGRVAMIGDGVNDAPAMASSTVSVAMGAAGSDVALQTADVALMADRLDNLPFAIGLSRQARRIIKQNLWISLGVVAILVPLTLLGIASLGPAVIAHEGSTMVVVLNALRLLAYKK
jgi:Cd2+/Zn2+-exporting ATPase